MDISGIGAGADFIEVIERHVSTCQVLVAIIGRGWLTSTDESGQKRLENKEDFVRLEIASALKRAVHMIPVLVQGATMPRADQVPDDLKPLVRCRAAELRDSRWDADVQDLVRVIAMICGRRRRAIIWLSAALAVMAGAALTSWVFINASTDSREASFRRVYYENFDYGDPQKLPAATAEIWQPGTHGDWETKIGNAVLTVCNVSGSPAASEANGRPVDQADAKVTLRVRLPRGTTGEAGVMFRKSSGEDAYYAFLATPGDAIMLYLNTGKALKSLWSGDAMRPGPDGFYSLKVVGRGNRLDLYADDRLVHTEDKAALVHGDPGVMAFGAGCYDFSDIAVSLPVVAPTAGTH
jgi:hypothetical protein